MVLRIFAYLWAFPGSALGLVFVPLAWLSGGRARFVQGVVEVHGGLVAFMLRRGVPGLAKPSAMTLGHVILGRDAECLDFCRTHEHVHVRQYERWGPFFLPAYLLASLILFCRGRDPYYDNPFEREAYDQAG